MKILDIKPNPNNPRIIKDDKYKKLLNSIKEFPKMLELRPIVIDKNNMILGGNMRYKACKELGIKEVPVKIAEDLTPEEEQRFIIEDNVGFGDWNMEMLANNWNTQDLENWGVDIDFKIEEPTAEEDDFEVNEGIQTDIVLGDLFEIGEHRLLCGDSTNIDQVNRLMNGEKADMVFSDPPYGMFLDADFSGMKGIGKGNKYDNVKGDADDFTPELITTFFDNFGYCKEIFLWGADYFAELLPKRNEGCFIVWDKQNNGEGCNDDYDKMFGSNFELCWSKTKHKRAIARVLWKGFFGMQNEDTKKRLHPTQKPIQLCDWFLTKFSKKNNIIIDLFGGSGSTMVASHQLNRKCYMMELEPKYVQTIVNRMLKLDPNIQIKKNGQIYNFTK